MKFMAYKGNPVIPRKEETFHSVHAANPDLLEFRGKLFLYFRGQGSELHDQMGVATVEPEKFNGVDWNFFKGNPIIKVSEDRNDFDCRHILDPGTVVLHDRVFLYYSGHSYDKPAAICLATSDDGFKFTKHDTNPIIEKAIAPEVVLKDGLVHLFYQRKNEGGFFEFFCSTSVDGLNFVNERKVFSPTGKEGDFDSFSVSTCRIWEEDGWYYMIYGASDKFDDYPHAFGLARSFDLMEWERYLGGPVFSRGEAGTWDEGGVWFGSVYKHGKTRYLWYEGCGTGMGTMDEESRSLSDKCRTEDYGGYGRFNFSQIGLATCDEELML
ncbi:MAG TPA: hypothetical protein PLP30_04855 [Clostridia bacterium]|nr:hypothetical protein [Clostridia bacterium]